MLNIFIELRETRSKELNKNTRMVSLQVVIIIEIAIIKITTDTSGVEKGND
jgi:hypothetical protein